MNYVNKKKYWKDIFLQSAGNSGAQVLGILGMPILTRLYSPEAFALQALFIQVVTLLVIFTSFRMEYFIPIAENKVESLILTKWIVKTGLLITILVTSILIVLNETETFRGFGVYFEVIFYAAPVTAYFISLSLAFQHEAQRGGAYKDAALAAFNSKLSYVVSGSVLSIFTISLGLILSTMFGAMGKLIILRNYIINFFLNIKSAQFKKNIFDKYKGRANGLIFSGVILSISTLIPTYYIGKYDMGMLGQYSLVLATVFIPSGLIGSAVGSVFYQRAGVLSNENDFEGLKSLWRETLIKLLYFASPVYLFIYFVSPWVYPVLFGDEWVVAGNLAQIVSISAFFSFLAGPLDKMSLALGVGYYLPLIHIIRMMIIMLIVLLSYAFSLSITSFIIIISMGISCVYLIDILACRFYLLGSKLNHEL